MLAVVKTSVGEASALLLGLCAIVMFVGAILAARLRRIADALASLRDWAGAPPAR
jgi:hypothetical protein